MTVFISRYHWKVESCHFFLRGWGTGGLSGPGVRVGPGSGVSVNASLDVTKLSVTLMSLPGILQKIFLTEGKSEGEWGRFYFYSLSSL